MRGALRKYENVKESQTGGLYNITRNGATQLTQTVRTVSEQETPQENKIKNKRSRAREAGAGACEISPTLSAPEGTQNTSKTYIVTAMQSRAGEDGTQTVAEERNISPRPVWGYEEGGGGTQGQRLGQTEAPDNPCGYMHIENSLTRPTIWRRKAKGNGYCRPHWP